mgnify:CR=1 FL=1
MVTVRPRLTDEERAQRKRDSWNAILSQTRPYKVPTVDEFVEDFVRRFGGVAVNTRETADEMLVYFGLPTTFTFQELRSKFREKISVVHPDHGGSLDEARKCLSFYEALKARVT